jgi:cell division protein ZipA
MSILQWALLILGVVVVAAILVISRRESRMGDGQWMPPSPPTPKPRGLPGADQMDIFGGGSQFDEFGVGRPRKKGVTGPAEPLPPVETDLFGAPTEPPSRSAPPVAPGPSAAGNGGRKPPSLGAPTVPPPARPQRIPPPLSAPAAPPPPAPAAPKPEAPSPPAAPASEADDVIIVLFVAEREATAINGRRIHAALQAQGLEFGARKIYHRMRNGRSQFSIASIIKPGELDPAQAEQFATPGLTAFMTLPGPDQPVSALEDLLTTCDRLAGALNGEVYDQQREALSEDTRRLLRARVAAGAQQNPTA